MWSWQVFEEEDLCIWRSDIIDEFIFVFPDSGENVSATVRREFVEEALNGLEMDQKDRLKAEEMVAKFFANGHQIYAGYVDDPR